MPRFRRGCFVVFALTLFIGVALVVSHPLWLASLHCYLDVSQSPHQADVIVILGGGDGERERYAAQLYHEGYAPRVLISGHVDHMQRNIDILKERDVPESEMVINDQANSTFDEAQQVLAVLLEMNAESALIVTDRIHTRRALATYKHVFSGYAIALTILSPPDGIDPNTWWRSKYRGVILIEYPKMLYYWIVYGVWSG